MQFCQSVLMTNNNNHKKKLLQNLMNIVYMLRMLQLNHMQLKNENIVDRLLIDDYSF